VHQERYILRMYTVIGVKITKYQIHFEKTRRFDSAAICDVRVLPFRYLLSESDCLHPVMTQLAPLFITTAWISFCANAAYCWSIDVMNLSERNLCHVYSWCSVCCFFITAPILTLLVVSCHHRWPWSRQYVEFDIYFSYRV